MPADGVANYYKTTSLGIGLSVSASDGSTGSTESHSYNRNTGLFTFSKNASANVDVAQSQASLSTAGLSVSGSANGAQTSFSGSLQSNGNNSSWPYYYNGTLTLSAHSVLIVTADALVQAAASNGQACGSYYYCNSTEQANASAFLNLSYSVSGQAGSTSGSSSNNLSISASARGEYTYQNHIGYDWSQPDWYNHPLYETIAVPKSDQTFEQSAKFYAVFTNTSDTEQLASFNLGVSVNGNASTDLLRTVASSPSAVPEANSLALAAVGLLTGGLMIRRRRQG
ncbi:PEP-CTERM sorting domain-containing protein [Aquabacterium sp.]|uniref:PEP-CTERM sorting domain-containing protein n=1 Tax=Aquabacterium sp. TaxID=1872578 RepID=UPI003D6CEBDE